jgi:hypothetical protein
MSLAEYVHHTGLSTDALKQLQNMGLIGARAADGQGLTADAEGAVEERETSGRPLEFYDALDLRAGWALKTLLDSGFGSEDLDFCARHLASAAEDVALVHYRLLRTDPRSAPRVSDERLKEALSELHTALMLRVLRRITAGTHERTGEADLEADSEA